MIQLYKQGMEVRSCGSSARYSPHAPQNLDPALKQVNIFSSSIFSFQNLWDHYTAQPCQGLAPTST